VARGSHESAQAAQGRGLAGYESGAADAGSLESPIQGERFVIPGGRRQRVGQTELGVDTAGSPAHDPAKQAQRLGVAAGGRQDVRQAGHGVQAAGLQTPCTTERRLGLLVFRAAPVTASQAQQSGPQGRIEPEPLPKGGRGGLVVSGLLQGEAMVGMGASQCGVELQCPAVMVKSSVALA